MMSSVAAVLFVFALLGALLALLRRVSSQRRDGMTLGVVEAVNLGGGRALTLVRSGHRYFLLGATNHSIALIAEIEGGDVASPHAAARRPAFPDIVARIRSTTAG